MVQDIANQPVGVHLITVTRRNISVVLSGAHSTGKTFLCDKFQQQHDDNFTDLDPLCYAIYQLGNVDAQQSILNEFKKQKACAEMIQRYRSSTLLTVLLEPSVECIHDDGVRMVESVEQLFKFNQCLAFILEQLQIPFIKIGAPPKFPLCNRIDVLNAIYYAAGGHEQTDWLNRSE